MITIGELEDRRDKTKKRIAELRRIHAEFDGLTDFQKDEDRKSTRLNSSH